MTDKPTVIPKPGSCATCGRDNGSNSGPKLLFEWRPEFNIGISSVDEQHQKIANLANLIHISLRTGMRRPNFIIDLISEMDDYIKEHFSDEERLMREMNYPGLAEQQKEHHEFIKKTREAHEEFSNSVFDVKGLLNFIVKWFIDHIQGTDRDFATWAQKHNKP
ncbi:bacteriohemerythrin [Bdellovibrionota bacterium FG-1]